VAPPFSYPQSSEYIRQCINIFLVVTGTAVAACKKVSRIRSII